MSDAVLSQFKEPERENTIDTKRKIKYGIIGTGSIAHTHMRELLRCPDIEIVGGADIVDGKARAFFDKYELYNSNSYTDYKDVVNKEKPDAVSICTYNVTHAECTKYCLENGVDVLLEKPFTVTLEEALDVYRVEKATGRILSVGFQPRMDNNMKKLKEIIQSGELGKIYYIQTGGGRRRGIPGRTFIEKSTAGVGALGDIGCYSLDMVLNSIGYPKPLTVTGYKSSYFGTNPKYTNIRDAKRFDVDDFSAGFIRLEGDIILDFRISWAMHINTPGDTIFLGTEGALRIPSTECWNGSVGGPMTLYKDVSGKQVEIEIPLCPPVPKGVFYHKIRSFIDAVKNGDKSPVPTKEIIINQAIIDGIEKSSELGKEIEINIPEI